MSDDLAAAYALRARAEALPGLIKRLAVAYMADGTRYRNSPDDVAREIAAFAASVARKMYPIEGEK
jgi:hypothetical protein